MQKRKYIPIKENNVYKEIRNVLYRLNIISKI